MSKALGAFAGICLAGHPQPRSQGFPFLSLGRREKALAPGGHMTFNTQMGVINYNNNELENPRWPPT
jgi:hypothetical protein